MMMRLRLQYAPHLLTCPVGAAVAAVRPREIYPRLGEVRSGSEGALEQLDAGGDLVLLEECSTEQPQAVDLTRKSRLERPQPRLRGCRAAGTQRAVCAAKALGELGV